MLRRPHVVAGLLGLGLLGAAAASPAAAQNPPAKGTVLSRDRTTVNARLTPGGKGAAKVKHGTRLRITCQASGPVASGPGGTSNIWDKVVVGSERLWVADVFLRTAGPGVLVAKLCGAPALSAAQTPGDTTGPCGITSPVAQLPPFETRKAFVAAAVPGAQRSDRETEVPASVTLAQAILETGSGRIAAGANNYFGIKATAVPDEGDGIFQWGVNGVGCVLRKTQEVIGGRSVTTIGAFRAYESLERSIEDHGARLLANPVYQGAFKYTEQPEKFARVIARYYATDPAYADKVVGLMRSEKLTRYDVKGSGSGAPAGATSTDGTSGGVTPSR
ncbi:MAG: glucosaminidase domain-containing protein [Geodermatophilaceae bacterium]|nr:glucosaminidase domain-containing protein [Geodermatophilaceae bacterium]